MNYPTSDHRYNVLIFNQFYPPDYAATGQLIEELALTLSQKGIKVRVFSGQPAYAFDIDKAQRNELNGQLNIRRTRSSRLWPNRIRGKAVNSVLFFIRAFLHLFRYQRENSLLIITTAPAFMTWLGLISHVIWKKKYICLIYDLYPNVLYQLGVLPKNHSIVKLWHTLNHHTWINAQEIIVLSDTMKERIIETCPQVQDKITVIHNWADGNVIKPMEKQDNWFAQKYGLQEKFTILYSGNMGRCHDMNTIIETGLKLKEYQDIFQFVFIGSGAQQQPLQDKVNEWGLNNFLFLPYQPKEVLPYSLTACDISLISITEDMEGVVAPSKLYSTLAGGNVLGVISPETSFLNQLVIEAQCGESFRNGDVQGLANFFLRLYHNKEICEQMGYNAREYFCNHFTKDIAMDKYANVIDKICLSSIDYTANK